MEKKSGIDDKINQIKPFRYEFRKPGLTGSGGCTKIRPRMKLKEIIKLVEGTVLTSKADLDIDIPYCGASDLMSDVLAHMKPRALLLTGLVNLQCIRTAEMADLAAVVFVRGKHPGADAVALAEDLGIPLIRSAFGMYQLCGRLYQAGLPAVL